MQNPENIAYIRTLLTRAHFDIDRWAEKRKLKKKTFLKTPQHALQMSLKRLEEEEHGSQ